MSETQYLNLVHCRIEAHQKKKIIGICLNKDCQYNRFFCHSCLIQSHRNHNSNQIGIFEFEQFLQYHSKQTYKLREYYTYAQSYIIQELEYILECIDTFQNQIRKQLCCYKENDLQLLIKKSLNKQEGQQYQEIVNQLWTQNSIEDLLKYVEVNNGQINLKQLQKTQLNNTDEVFIEAIRQTQHDLEQIIKAYSIRCQIKSFPQSFLELNRGQYSTQEKQIKSSERFQKLRSEIDNMQMAIDSEIAGQARLIKENKSNASLQEQLLLILNENVDLSNKLEEYKASLDNERILVETYMSQIENLQKLNQQQQETVEQCKIKIKLQKEFNQQQQETIEQQKIKIEKQMELNQQQKDQKEAIEQCKQIIENLKKEKQRVTQQINNCQELQVTINNQIQTINQLKSKINEQNMNKQNLLQQIQQLKITLERSSGQLLILKAEILQKNTMNQKLEAEYISILQDKNVQIISLKHNIESQTETITKFSINQQSLFEEINQLKWKLKIQQDIYLELLAQIEFKEQKISQLKQSRTQLRFYEIPIDLKGHQDKVKQAIISQDGSIIVSSSFDNTIKVWETKSKQILLSIQLEAQVYSMALSSNNQLLAYYFNKQINLYDLKQTGHTVILNSTGIIESIVFSQDTQYLLAGGDDRKIIVMKINDMKQVHIFETIQFIQKIIISPDNILISCLTSYQGSIYIWNFQTKTKLIQVDNIHHQGFSLQSSIDSSIYVTSGSEGLIKIWNLSQSQNSEYSFTFKSYIAPSSMQVQALLTMDKQYIICICKNHGKIMVYERESGLFIQELDSAEKSGLGQSISISNNMKVLISTNFTNDIKVWTRQ